MNYYLVDYENVKSHGLDGIVKMTPDDVVSIFYSENADSMSFSLHQKLNETRAHVIYEKVEVGTKNALDFQLVTELGYLIRDMQDQDVSFFIVSKDKGYGNTVTYWKKRGVRIAQVVDVSGLDEEKIENDLKMRVEPLVEPLVHDTKVADRIVKMILQYKTKQGINNALMKEFPSNNNKRASEIYTAIKPLLSDKKGTVALPPQPEKPVERAEMPQSRFEKQSEIFESILMKADSMPAGPLKMPGKKDEAKKPELSSEPAVAEKAAVAPKEEQPAEASEEAPEKAKPAKKKSSSRKKTAKKAEPAAEQTAPVDDLAAQKPEEPEPAVQPDQPEETENAGKPQEKPKRNTRRKKTKTAEKAAAEEAPVLRNGC